MKHLKFIPTLLLSVSLAAAQQTQIIKTQTGHTMEVQLLECFRQNPQFALCNYSLRNTSEGHLQIWPSPETITAKSGGKTLTNPWLSVAGSPFDDRSSIGTWIIPRGHALLMQVKLELPAEAAQIDQLQISTAKFSPVPLTEEPWERHTLNVVTGDPVDLKETDSLLQGIRSCYRLQGSDVRCMILNKNTQSNKGHLTLQASEVQILGPDGVLYPANGLVLGGKPVVGNNWGRTDLPYNVGVTGYSTFSLPQSIKAIPALLVGTLVFYNLPIEEKTSDPLFTLSSGAPVLEARGDSLRGKMGPCRWVGEKVQCQLTLKSVDSKAHRLSRLDEFPLLTENGFWNQAVVLGDEGIEVPIDGAVEGTLTFDLPAGSLRVPYLEVAGMEFRHIPVVK